MMCVLFQAHESLTISRYELTPAVDIERGYLSKSGAGSAGFVFLCLKSLGLPKFETYEFERFGGWFIGDVFVLLASSALNLSQYDSKMMYLRYKIRPKYGE